MLVIPRRRPLAPRDLGSLRERTSKTATKEAKTAQSKVKLGRFGLFVVLLGRFPTGSSFSAPSSHGPYYSHHFVPLCTTILTVSLLLSSRNLKVPIPLLGWFWKIRRLVV